MIGSVRERHPDFVFAAEAYWDLEWDLQQLGFDYCYDKRLYDRLIHEGPAAVRGHLQAGLDFQRHLLRFLENHDEPRAASGARTRPGAAAAVAIATLPGAALWHEGQFEGWRVHVPVFLARRPPEPTDEELRRFHLELLAATNGRRRAAGRGRWDLLDTTVGPATQAMNSCWPGPGRMVTSDHSSSSTTPTVPPQPESTCPGTTSARTRGSSPTPDRSSVQS